MADRMKFIEGANNSYKMEIVHCHESDTGTYIAKATNGFENATCTAQLIVEKCNRKLNLNYNLILILIFF